MKLKIGITCYPSVGGSGVVGDRVRKAMWRNADMKFILLHQVYHFG